MNRIPLLLSLILPALPLSAATATWKGGTVGVPDTWNISTNWFSAIGPSGNDVVFPAAGSWIGMMQNTDATLLSMQVFASGYGFNNSGIAGSSINVSNGITVAFSGTGFTTFNTPLRLDASQPWEMDGSRGTIWWNEPVNLNGKTLTVTGTGIHEFNGGIAGAGSIVKSGTGRVEINSAMNGGGSVSVEEGTMEFNHAVMSKAVNFTAPGIVAGNGTVASLTGTSGTVRPGGGAIASLNVAGSLIMGNAATLDITVQGDTPGTGYDSLSVASSVTLINATLQLTVTPAYQAILWPPIMIINNMGANPVSGTFAGLPEAATITKGNITFRISYIGGDGNDVTLLPVSVAPSGVERVWTGNVNSFWSTPGNWAGGIVPGPGDNVQFPEVAPAKKNVFNDYPWGVPLNLIRLTAGGYSLTGAGVYLMDGIVQQAPPGAAPVTLAMDMTVPFQGSPAMTTRIRLQSGGELTVEPASPFLLPLAASVLTLQNDVPGAVLISRVGVLGAGVVAKQGSGPVVLEAASTHSGGLHVITGTLQLAANDVLGTGAAVVEPGAVLEMHPAPGAALDIPNTLHLGGTLRAAGTIETQTWSGPVFLPTGLEGRFFAADGQLFLTGAIAGNGAARFEGAHTIRLLGASPNTFTGQAVVDDVVVILGKTAGITAIPGDIEVKSGLLTCNTAAQIADAATLTIGDSGHAIFNADETVSGLVMTSAKLWAYATVTVTGAVTVLPSYAPSQITGELRTGASDSSWNIADGPSVPDLQFTGSLGHSAGGRIIKTGLGTLLVMDGTAPAHPHLSFRLDSGAIEWNDDNGSGPFGPEVELNGGIITGSGRVRNISTVLGGTLAPGSGLGAMLSENTALRANAAFAAELNGAAVPAVNDTLRVKGTVDLGGAALVLKGVPFSYGDSAMLIDNDGSDPVNSSFAGLPEGGTMPVGNAMLLITYQGGDGNDVVLTRVAPPAPELTLVDLAGSLAGGGLPGAPPARFAGTGLPGFLYALEISDDLEHWVIATTTTGDSITGEFLLAWSPPTIPGRRYFRVRAL